MRAADTLTPIHILRPTTFCTIVHHIACYGIATNRFIELITNVMNQIQPLLTPLLVGIHTATSLITILERVISDRVGGSSWFANTVGAILHSGGAEETDLPQVEGTLHQNGRDKSGRASLSDSRVPPRDCYSWSCISRGGKGHVACFGCYDPSQVRSKDTRGQNTMTSTPNIFLVESSHMEQPLRS